MRATIADDVAALRTEARRTGQHARTPGAVADLALGWKLWLRFAADAGALTAADAAAAWQRAWRALVASGERQAGHHADQAPAPRFLTLLASALASGGAHVAGSSGAEPAHPEAWGWRAATVGAGDYQRAEWRPQGSRVGWLDGDDLYLDPEAAHAAAQRVGETGGGALGVAPKTLSKRLHEAGMLRSTGEPHGLTVRRPLAGARRRVLHVAADALEAGEPGQSVQPGHVGGSEPLTGTEPPTDGRIPRPDSGACPAESGQKTRPTEAPPGTVGRVGRVGRILPDEPPERAATATCALCGASLPEGGSYLCDGCGRSGADRWTA